MLFHHLGQHPDVFTSESKEPHFFGTDLIYRHRISLAEYLTNFEGAAGELRVGEASTSYLFSQLAAREIQEFSPAAKIVIMLRHPVETMHSIHGMNLYFAAEAIDDFQQALEAEPSRKASGRCPRGANVANYLFYRSAVKYADQVKRYFDVFGRENVQVILHDDVVQNLPDIFRKLLGFLDLDTGFRPRFELVNENRIARSKLLQRVIFDQDFVRLRARLLPSLLDQITFGNLRRLNTSTRKRKPMDPGLRRKLVAEFTPEIERLGKLLDRDLTHWFCEQPQGLHA